MNEKLYRKMFHTYWNGIACLLSYKGEEFVSKVSKCAVDNFLNLMQSQVVESSFVRKLHLAACRALYEYEFDYEDVQHFLHANDVHMLEGFFAAKFFDLENESPKDG